MSTGLRQKLHTKPEVVLDHKDCRSGRCLVYTFTQPKGEMKTIEWLALSTLLAYNFEILSAA
jgi:hypothetical protein